MSLESDYADVLIIGGGPTGLLTALALQRMNVSTCVIERLDKDNLPIYGRACTLYPRTLEMLDQLELLDDFVQVGSIGRGAVTYKDGKRVTSRGWQQLISPIHGTYLDFLLNIRLKYSERLVQDAYEKGGGHVTVATKFLQFSLDLKAEDGYKVSAIVAAVESGQTRTIKSKYIIGADGGSSTLRRLSGIHFYPDSTIYKWVRIDAVVETDMPDSEVGFASIESVTHGNVLWVALDHGRTRIGFSLSPEMIQKYGGDKLNEAQAIEEAKAAMAPFSVRFKTVDWYTVYSIQRGVAEKYIQDDCVILAGDACHTHSSGAAQGMNTGVHDAVNLAWKLGGVLRGWYKKDILQTYEDERRPVALEVIRQDKEFSTLISGKIPEQYHSSSLTADELLTKTTADNAGFILGLSVHYDENVLNVAPTAGAIFTGWRAPDALVVAPGSRVPLRLQQLTPNTGSFWVIIFAGEPLLSAKRLLSLRNYLDSPQSFTKRAHSDAIKFLTVIAGVKINGGAALGVESFGRIYYDANSSAHARYGMSVESGGIAVLRPDGILAFATMLDEGKDLGEYFSNIVEHSKDKI